MTILRLVSLNDDANVYNLFSGETNVGTIRLEFDAKGSSLWFYSLYALHLEQLPVERVGSAESLGEAFCAADRQWDKLISLLGLQPKSE